MKPIGSATTTILSKAASATGMQHGEHGALMRSSSAEIAQWLASKGPAEVDSAAVSRASSRGVELKVKTDAKAVYDDNGNMVDYITFARGCDAIGDDGAKAVVAVDLENFCTPAPIEAIEGWLAELSVIVARRGDDEFGDSLRLTAYSSRLGKYPADVAKAALLDKSWKWWPTWSELEAECERLFSPRKQMVAALDREPPKPEPEWRHATPEERQRAQDLVDAMFPNKSQDERKAVVGEAMKGYCMKDIPEGGST